MPENIDKFIVNFSQSLDSNTFVKMTLGNYRGSVEQLQKLTARRIETKKGRRIELLQRYATRDVSKNYPEPEAIEIIRRSLGREFFGAHLFTTENDFHLEFSKKGRSRLTAGKPSFTKTAATVHDREKKVEIDPQSLYLQALGITAKDGRVRDKQQDKWRQINKFVEILGAMFDNSPLKENKTLNIVDMGSGKGYLTFAAYDYFKNSRGIDVSITGVELRPELVNLCSRIAEANQYSGLRFVQGSIDEYLPADVDILIALHACDTATDDALFKGIVEKAAIIIAAPCCHKELRPQIKPPEMLTNVLKHGVMLERTAELLTDGLRSLLLERSGYATKLFEFVPVEHTPKNNMLAAIRRKSPSVSTEIDEQISSLMEYYGIRSQRLLQLLTEDLPA